MKYQKLSQTRIERINSLTRKGNSLNTISNKLNIKKTTVYYHFKKIRGRTVKPILIDVSDKELLGELMGVFAGDGGFNKTKQYQYRVSFYFNKTEDKYVKELKEIFYVLFQKYPMQFQRQNKLILRYNSKAIIELINNYLTWNKQGKKSHSIRLITENHCESFRIGFIRGNLDSDGYLSKEKITFATSSPYLANNINNFLNDLGINYHYYKYLDKRKNRVPMYHINIRKPKRNKFLDLIKPRELKNLKK